MANKKLIRVDDTKFIFRTNFSGDPDNDPKYHSSTRKGSIIIPDDLAEELEEEGYKVGVTKPREGQEEGFIPRHYVTVIINTDSDVAKEHPPKIYLVSGEGEPRRLDKDSIGIIDHVYVTNVNVTLEKFYSKRYDRRMLYVKVMYVEQDVDDDPYAERYKRNREPDEELPFD